jgi:3-oxoacyl-[acyl-carrier protein] reductase
MGIGNGVTFITEGTRVAELCIALARRGSRIGFTYEEDVNTADRIIKESEVAGSEAVACPVKNLSPGDLSAAIVETAERFGGLDTLIYASGFQRPHADGELILDLDEEDWDDAINSGPKGFFLSCKYALPYLISSQSAGIIALDATPEGSNIATHSASRALRAAAEYLGDESSQYGISVTCLKIADDDWMMRVACG